MKIVYILFILIFFAYGCNDYGKKRSYTSMDLFYTSQITETQADSLGGYLVRCGFAEGPKSTVQITKSGDTFQFRIVVKQNVEKDTAYTSEFPLFAKELSDSVFNGNPVQLEACDENLKTLAVFKIAGK